MAPIIEFQENILNTLAPWEDIKYHALWKNQIMLAELWSKAVQPKVVIKKGHTK